MGLRKSIKFYFMFPLEVPKKLIWSISIKITLQSNLLNMTKILVYSVAWYLICMMPEKFWRKVIDFWIEYSFKIESLGYMDTIKFPNTITMNCVREEEDQHPRYNMVKYLKKWWIWYFEWHKWQCEISSTDWHCF